MPRRYVVQTWNNAAAPKKVKPVVPLRYRISPVEKHFDDLDALEAELEREYAAGTVESDQYHHLRSVLEHRRGGLSLKRRKAVGETIPKAPRAIVERTGGTRSPMRYARPRARAKPPLRGASSFETKLMIVGAVFLYFFIKSV